MDADQARALLGEERDRLSSIKSDLDAAKEDAEQDSSHEVSSYAQHQADVATETFDREKDLSILDNIEGELSAIEHALERLDANTYGTCEACGKAIGDDRLEAMPATRFCLDDQGRAEREQRAAAPNEIVDQDDTTSG